MATLDVTKATGRETRPTFNTDSSGSSITLVDAETHDFPNDGKTLLLIQNGATAATITIPSVRSNAFTIPINVYRMFGPFETETRNASAGARSGVGQNDLMVTNTMSVTVGTPTTLNIAVIAL